jgi:hypothetical protein
MDQRDIGARSALGERYPQRVQDEVCANCPPERSPSSGMSAEEDQPLGGLEINLWADDRRSTVLYGRWSIERREKQMKRLLAVSAAVCVAILVAATAALAAGPQPQSITCNGLGTIQIVTGPATGTQDNENVEVWGAARIVGGGTLIPTSFTFTAYDDTVDLLLFSGVSPKGSGNANQNQDTTTCVESQTTTLDQIWPPDAPLPDGAALSDTVTLSFSVNAIVKP